MHTVHIVYSSSRILYAAQLSLSDSDIQSVKSTFACQWRETSKDSSFSGYCVIAFSDSLSVLALGNLKGFIKLLQLSEDGTYV